MMQNILLLIGSAIAAPLSDSSSQDYSNFKATNDVGFGRGHQEVTKSSLHYNRSLVRRVSDSIGPSNSNAMRNNPDYDSPSGEGDELRPWDEGFLEAEAAKQGKSIDEVKRTYVPINGYSVKRLVPNYSSKSNKKPPATPLSFTGTQDKNQKNDGKEDIAKEIEANENKLKKLEARVESERAKSDEAYNNEWDRKKRDKIMDDLYFLTAKDVVEINLLEGKIKKLRKQEEALKFLGLDAAKRKM